MIFLFRCWERWYVQFRELVDSIAKFLLDVADAVRRCQWVCLGWLVVVDVLWSRTTMRGSLELVSRVQRGDGDDIRILLARARAAMLKMGSLANEFGK